MRAPQSRTVVRWIVDDLVAQLRKGTERAKAFTVDDEHGFVGSFNLDPRSAIHNTELGVLFHSPTLVAELRTIVSRQTEPDLSYRLRLREGDVQWVDGERIWDTEPETTLWSRLAAKVFEWLPLDHQL